MKTKTTQINNKKLIITSHAFGEAKSRLGLKGESLRRFVKKALTNGLNYSNADDKLKKFIKSKYINHGYKANKISVYGHGVYVVDEKRDRYVVYTVLELPDYYKDCWNEYSRNRR